MTYAVLITPTALAEVQEAYEWLAEQSPPAAERWRAALLDAVQSLETLPTRCSLAPESEWLGREIRQLLHGKRRGVYRILFEIRRKTVYVLRVRHGARELLDDVD